MPWKEETVMSLRKELIELTKEGTANISEICRRLEISRKTAYKWINRKQESGTSELEDRSRRPLHSPRQTDPAKEGMILAVREDHPTWGARKIRRVLQDAGNTELPAASTITAILQRNQRIDAKESQKHKAFQRFEREKPNELWQMDFKGYFPLTEGGYCHPLTVVDDHSRFLVGLQACSNETWRTVQSKLTMIFRLFGLPDRILMDNGSPWGDDRDTPYTILGAWLLRLNVAISHGRPYHPQTQGKDERLNRTLFEEVIKRIPMANLEDSQSRFDAWWYTYNHIRPHEALNMDTPAAHYQPSSRPFPEILPPVIYESNDIVRKIDDYGKLCFSSHKFHIGRAFRGQLVAIRPSDQDGQFFVFFCQQKVSMIDLRIPES